MTNSISGHSRFASRSIVPVFTPKVFASMLAAMHTVVSASIGTTPMGLPRSRGSACCSTEAKYELKSTSRDVSKVNFLESGLQAMKNRPSQPMPLRGMVMGRFVASMNFRRKTRGSAMSFMGATEVPAPEM